MLTTLMKYSLSLAICLLTAGVGFSTDQCPKITTEITLNNVVTPVYFNDGDTFKILDGVYKNARVRVAGFNTLETYGPIHEWAKNAPDYLYNVASKATKMAQDGRWNCMSEGKRDGYGRMLAVCNDLALSLITAGYAHAYSIDDKPAANEYLDAQDSAQRRRAGIWHRGTPDFIITSLHSADEEGGGRGLYNRLISSADGHTEKWEHNDAYSTCERVCLTDEVSCMVYVPFSQRYGTQRPECIRSIAPQRSFYEHAHD